MQWGRESCHVSKGCHELFPGIELNLNPECRPSSHLPSSSDPSDLVKEAAQLGDQVGGVCRIARDHQGVVVAHVVWIGLNE